MKPFSYAAVLAAALVAAAPLEAAAQQVMQAPRVASAAGNSMGTTIVGSYYEDTASTSCSGFVNCFLLFTAVPAKKKLAISNISCTTKTKNPPIFMAMIVGNPPSGSAPRQLNVPIPPYTYAKDIFSSDQYLYYLNINAPIRFLVQAGAYVQLNFYTSGTNAYSHSMNCNIVGTLGSS